MLVRGDISITAEDRTGQMLRNREKVLGTLNKAALVLLTRREESFDTAMSDGLDLVAEIAEISRMSVFRNTERPSGLHLSQIYRWRKDANGIVGVWPQLNDVPYSAFAPQLRKILEAGECISGSVDALPNTEMFKRFGCVTVLVIPVFDEGKFWGLTLFEKIRDEDFSESDADVLRAASAMLVTAVIHNEESKMMRLANEQSQLMLDAAPFAITMWDKNFNVVDCSQAALDVFGYSSKQELMERFVCDVPEYQPCGRRSMEILAEAATEAFRTGSCHLEWTGRAANGEPTIFQDIAVRVKYKGDYALMLYSRDIWEEKKAQEELARRDEMLVAQAHWYQSVLDGIPLPLSVSDTDMNLIFVNKAAENCFDKKREELLGRPCHNWNASICRTDNCSIVRARRGEKQTFFKHNGSSYQVVSEILTDLAGHTAGHIETLQDVTEAENMARLQADTENKAKSTFLATMSHEMRTPLNAVIGMTAIGRRSAEIERKNYALDRIEEASTHLLGVINDILDMSKIEAGKLELSPLEYNFEKMLQKVLTVINHRVHEKRQRFSVNIDGSVPRFVIGDDQRLAQIIANLLSNAVKFTLEGGEITLNVSLLGEENGLCEIRFEVADSGIGISAAQQKKLFSAFSQAGRDTTRSFGGTRLGLAISKQLVEMMGGKIWVESKPGNGSRFIFTVKVPLGVTNPRSLLRPGVAWEKLRVLAVDGSGATHQHFEDSFERLGVPCHTVANADDARQLIETHGPFDVYFISWRMSGMSGAELARWIKSREDKGAVVLISSAGWEDLQEAVRGCGADKGLVKPMLSSSLVDCLNELFGNTGERQNHDITDEFAGKSLLLAEDIEINREIVISLLEGTGIAIDCAENGEAALAMMEANPEKYDIVFMDMQMPIMDGLSATRRIRALPSPRCREVPIIAMTANVFKDDIENCFTAGMNDHIGKPISVDDMLGKLRQYLGGKAPAAHGGYFVKVETPKNSCKIDAALTSGMRISIDIRLADAQGGKVAIMSLPSLVEEVYRDGTVLIQAPMFKGEYYPFPHDEMFLMYFAAKGAGQGAPEVFALPVRFAGRTERGKSVCAKMKPLGEIEHSNRRRYFRLSPLMPVLLKRLGAKDIPVNVGMLDFSEGGMLLATENRLELGEKVILEFDLGGLENEIVEAVVLRADKIENESYRFSAAVRFENNDEKQKKRFYRFIAERQMGNGQRITQ